MELDLLPQWQFFIGQGLQTLTYSIRTSDTAWGTPFTIPNCLRREATKEVSDVLEVDLSRKTVFFEIWVANCPANFVPQRGDLILDNFGDSWIVSEVDDCTLQTRWRTHVYSQNLAHRED